MIHQDPDLNIGRLFPQFYHFINITNVGSLTRHFSNYAIEEMAIVPVEFPTKRISPYNCRIDTLNLAQCTRSFEAGATHGNHVRW